MHTLEPYYAWRNHYIASEDARSPFFERTYSEFEYSTKVYNYFIHPQWDSIHSSTLFCKILFVDYDERFAIIEFIGEWNDTINNDIMHLKRNIIDLLIADGISRFVLIGENVLNFHGSDDCYYEEWFEDLEDDRQGWIAAVNFQDHVLDEMSNFNIDSYINSGGNLQIANWRTLHPLQFCMGLDSIIQKRLN